MAEQIEPYNYEAEADALINLHRVDPQAAVAVGKALGYALPDPLDTAKNQANLLGNQLDNRKKAYDLTTGRAYNETKQARDLSRSTLEDVGLVAEKLYPGEDNEEIRTNVISAVMRRGEDSLTPDRLAAVLADRKVAAGVVDNANAYITDADQSATMDQQDAISAGLKSIGARYGYTDPQDLAKQFDKQRGWFTLDDETNSADNKIRGVLYDVARYSNARNGAKRDSNFFSNDPFDDDVLDGFVDGIRKNNGGKIDYQKALTSMDLAFDPGVATRYAKEVGAASVEELYDSFDNSDNPRAAWSAYYRDLYNNMDYFTGQNSGR